MLLWSSYVLSTSRETSDGLSVILGSAIGKAFPGTFVSFTLRSMHANTSKASIMAKPVPMQFRGPAPKGTYAPLDPKPESSLM